MKWFLVIYMFSTNDLLITEMPTLKECKQAQKKFKNTIMKSNKDVKNVTCESGEIMDEYTPEGGKVETF